MTCRPRTPGWLARTAVVGGGALGIGLAALAAAPAASAADLGNVTYFCSGDGTVNTSSMSGYVGDTFTITPDPTGSDCPLTSSTPGIVTWSVTNGGTTTPDEGAVWNIGHATVTFASAGTTTFSIGYQWVPQQLEISVTVLAAADAGAGSPPADVIQEFGLPDAGTCDGAAAANLDWAGVARGGWTVSWGEWMHGGTGGAVCSRTLHYDAGAGGWVTR